VFLMSALATAYGLYQDDQTALVCGALWPALHAVFHIFIWVQRGVPLDVIGASNLFGIQAPAWAMLVLSLRFQRRRPSHA